MARILASIKPVRRNRDDILFARFVGEHMAKSPLFASAPVPLATFLAHVAELEAAETRTLSRTVGAVSARDALFARVRTELNWLRAYVQAVADAAGTEAAVVIAAAGMRVMKSSAHGRHPFKARKGPNPGSVSLYAIRERTRASYEWQMSLDGASWQSAETTVKASVVLRGLEAGRRYSFRYRTVTKAGKSDFSQVITFTVE